MTQLETGPISTRRGVILASLWWLFTQTLGYFGAALVAYSVIAGLSNPWEPMETYAPVVSNFLTIVGVMVTAASVYGPPGYHPPWKSSRWVVAPIIIGSCIITTYFLVAHGHLPPVLVNGFAMLGLSGGLQRMIPTNLRHVGA
jgi:hypothetical protein